MIFFTRDEIESAASEGLIRRQWHPSGDLQILNYTEKTTYEGAWNPLTRACRGLILDQQYNVVARLFPKFFNHGEPNAPELDMDAFVVVSDKLDGCFPRHVALNLWGGGTARIGDIVRDRREVTLVGMDEQGNMVPSRVTDWHNNGRKDNWLDIEVDTHVSRYSGGGSHPNRLRVTTNHHIMVNGEYRAASEIRVGDSLVTQGWEPDENALHLIRASLLGDGCLMPSMTRPAQSKYQEGHSEKQIEYALSLRDALGTCANTRSDTISGYGSRMVWSGSKEYAALGELRAKWYRDGIKCIPEDLSWIDDFAVAKWLMDDGTRQRFPNQADRIGFATYCFSEEDVCRLGDRLVEMYGVSYHVFLDRNHGPLLTINSGRKQQIRVMWEAIAPHVHPSMRYKIPEEFQLFPYRKPVPGFERVVALITQVASIRPVAPTKRNFPHGRVGFDVTTETGNYLARGVLVHNSLGILYPDPAGGFAIATRGSFTSDQAIHGTEIWKRFYEGGWEPLVYATHLFEIVYPANRIVVDYGNLDDLILLASLDNLNGKPYYGVKWPGPEARRFPHKTLHEALTASPRPGREGMVVYFPDLDERVKLKQDEYVALHRILTGTNARNVWEVAAVNACAADVRGPKDWGSFLRIDPTRAEEVLVLKNDWLAGVPDEFYGWIKDIQDRCHAGVNELVDQAEVIVHEALRIEDRRARYEHVKASGHPALKEILRIASGRDIDTEEWNRLHLAAWLAVRPEPTAPFAHREAT